MGFEDEPGACLNRGLGGFMDYTDWSLISKNVEFCGVKMWSFANSIFLYLYNKQRT